MSNAERIFSEYALSMPTWAILRTMLIKVQLVVYQVDIASFQRSSYLHANDTGEKACCSAQQR